MAIDPVSLLGMPSAATASATAPLNTGFADALGQLLSASDSSAAGANEAVNSMMQGTGDVHDAMIAMQKAEMTLELVVQVRNKLVQAYQDVMRMTV